MIVPPRLSDNGQRGQVEPLPACCQDAKFGQIRRDCEMQLLLLAHGTRQVRRQEVDSGGSGTVLPAGLPVPAGGARPAGPAARQHALCRRRPVRQPRRPPGPAGRADREPSGPATIVFNGDVHWLDVDPDDFQAISETVLAHHAIKGNVEAELAATEDAGCGCAYPDYISDDVVERSNQIMTRLRATAARFPALVGRLDELPRYLTASVGGQRIGILHGDPESLAGWRLALEAMEPGNPWCRRQVGWHGPPTTTADLLDWFGRAEVSVFACTARPAPTGRPTGRAAAGW